MLVGTLISTSAFKVLQSSLYDIKSLVKQNIFVVYHLKSKNLTSYKIQKSLINELYLIVLFAASRIRRYAAHVSISFINTI